MAKNGDSQLAIDAPKLLRHACVMTPLEIEPAILNGSSAGSRHRGSECLKQAVRTDSADDSLISRLSSP